jgi:hypothetical protein
MLINLDEDEILTLIYMVRDVLMFDYDSGTPGYIYHQRILAKLRAGIKEED